jgi:hypothetical protein
MTLRMDGDILQSPDSRLSFAGPLMTWPAYENLEPWQGQSNDFSESFHFTVHPRCMQTAENE